MYRNALSLIDGMLFSCRAPHHLLALLLGILIVASGCNSKGGGVKDIVTGKVTYKGQNVAGNIYFVGSDGKEVGPGPIGGGLYTLPNPPRGECKVIIKPMPGMPAGGGAGGQKHKPDGKAPGTKGGEMPGGAAPMDMGVEAPPKYSKLGPDNDLKATVTGGKQEINFELR